MMISVDPVQTEIAVARFFMRLSISCLRPRDDDEDHSGVRYRVSKRYRALAWKHFAAARAFKDARRAAA
jgi:hypothetical protein